MLLGNKIKPLRNELEKKTKEARRQYKNRETISCKNAEEAIKFLESL